MPPSSASSLFADLDVSVTPDAPIGAMTWYGIGGRADLLVNPHSVEGLETLIRRCHRSGVPLSVLGGGANLLVADEGVDGIVVKLDSTAFRQTQYNTSGEPRLMRAIAGADLPATVIDAARRGLEGLSHMAGIPGSIGGAICMNAGGAFGCIGDVVENVTCLTRTGDRVTYPASELRFEYRHTNIPDPIILSATFRMTPGDPIAVRERVKEIFAYKKSTQPLAESSAGCAFKNPIDPVTEKRVSAGHLIEQAQLKGFTVGGASISDRHANFILARPGATAADVLRVIEEAKQRVFEHSGIELVEEIRIWRRGEQG